MWAVQLPEPGRAEVVELADLEPELSEGQVLLRVRAAGLCGSDMPRFKGTRALPAAHAHALAPVHEVVGEVVQSASPGLSPGRRVVGTLGRHGGLAELVVASASMLMAVPEGLDDVEAVVVQPLATVVRAFNKFPDVRGQRAAVIGLGPIGLAFCHVLRHGGIGHLSAVDPIERAQLAKSYGADEFFQMTSAEWLERLGPKSRPQVVVEAVGHQQGTVSDAVHAVCEHGFVFGFGEPDDCDYLIPYEQLYMKDVTLAAGRTLEWPQALQAGAGYFCQHRSDFAGYVSHVLPVAAAQQAYSLYATPQVGRLKVVLVPRGL
jgi:L-iditol 2-dehydrogenase